jgi:hypothetical protein
MSSNPAPLDAKVSSILGQRLDSATDADDLDEDALFDELEREDDSAYRAHRLEQLHKEVVSAKEALKQQSTHNDSNSHNTTTIDAFYPTLTDDRAVLDLTTNTDRCIVHFSHPDFGRCAVMDEHLRLLAPRHHEVRFARVDVRNCPFVVEKLSIRVLPCVIGFVDGNSKERIVGFEGLVSIKSIKKGGADNFQTADLEKRFVEGNILVRGKLFEETGANRYNDGDDESESESENDTGRRGIRDRASNRWTGGDDSGDDWD